MGISQSMVKCNPHRIFMGCLFVLFSLAACQQSPAAVGSPTPVVSSIQHYSVKQTLVLDNQGPGQPEKQNLWVALIRDVPPYQKLETRKVSPSTYELVVDEYGNEYAEFDFSDHPAGTEIRVEIEYQVAVNELKYELGACEGAVPQDFTQPELRVESTFSICQLVPS